MEISRIIAPAASLFFTSIAFAAPAPKVGVKAGLIEGILHAGPFVQFLLVMMVALSVISWAVIFTKWRQLAEFRESNALFSEEFWKASSLDNVFSRLSQDPEGNLARVFKSAYTELQKIAESGLNDKTSDAPRLSGLDNLERTIRKSVESEVARAESRLGFLATTGSTSPFIGLLGTVVGIMGSFSNIASSGSASLAVVAPGISEALFSTAVGLFAALPAVAAYNVFVGKVRRLEMDLNSFGSDFLNVTKRNFFRDA
ncbi:MAG TPA: MotA/TolQ/ExbB proton channel family protein [Bdellovibrionales bacterium]|nr:MotA/TolQ/ExbB proton channel family protein [Bdellovibrionales bacterium]